MIYPTDDECIDQEQARILYEEHCAILVVENLPVGSEIGIDLSSFSAGEKFRGIKLIPPGVHFVFASAIDKAGQQHGPRYGFYHIFREKELLIKRWSPRDEDFDDSYQPNEEEQKRYQTNMRDLDRYLGAYRFSKYKTFLGLTSLMTQELLDQIVPECRRIRAMPYLIRDEEKPGDQTSYLRLTKRQPRQSLNTRDVSKSLESNLLLDSQQAKETRIRFTPIAIDHSFLNLESHAEITRYNLDTTMKLEQIFENKTSPARLLGEFQFAFLTLILAHVYDCFEQWKQLLMLICCADSALSKHGQFFNDFTQILHLQLAQIDDDMFEDVLDQENLIRHHLDLYFQNVSHGVKQNHELVQKVAELRQFLEEKFKWNFDIDLDDEKPVIVEL